MRVDYEPSFVDGIGSPEVFPEMFELTRELVDGSLVVDVDEVANAVRLLAERARVVAEGAGAASLAAAMAGGAGERQGRLRRLGREHRRLEAVRDPHRLGRRRPLQGQAL